MTYLSIPANLVGHCQVFSRPTWHICQYQPILSAIVRCSADRWRLVVRCYSVFRCICICQLSLKHTTHSTPPSVRDAWCVSRPWKVVCNVTWNDVLFSIIWHSHLILYWGVSLSMTFWRLPSFSRLFCGIIRWEWDTLSKAMKLFVCANILKTKPDGAIVTYCWRWIGNWGLRFRIRHQNLCWK